MERIGEGDVELWKVMKCKKTEGSKGVREGDEK